MDTLFTDIADEILEIVKIAIHHHSDGMNAEEALYEYPLIDKTAWSRESLLNTLGCCWDADRLDLLRLGIIPRETKMSTPYWHDVLPLAAKLNKMTALLYNNTTYYDNEDEWFN